MHVLRLDHKFRILTLLTASAGLMSAPAAMGASATVTVGKHAGDRSALTLSKSQRQTLRRQHVSFQATRPATHPGSHLYFPQASGKWDFSRATGTLSYSGTLRVRLGRRSFVLSGLTFTRSAKGTSSLSARSGRRKFTFLALTGRARIQRHGNTETINGLSAHVTSQAARRLNGALHKGVARSNQNLGSFVVTVSSAASKARGGAGTPGSGGNSTPGAHLVFGHALDQALRQNGLPPLPILPASGGLPAPAGTAGIPGADGTSLTLPAATGSRTTAGFNAGTLTGTIPLSGGIQLGQGTGAISLTDPMLTLGTGTEGSSLSFSVNGGPAVKLFSIDTSGLEQSTTSNGDLSLAGLTATLSAQGAATINHLAGTQVVKPAQPVGGLTVIVPSPPGS